MLCLMEHRAVVWTRHLGPRKLGELELRGDGVWVESGELSVVTTAQRYFVEGALPPQLQALVPPRNSRNLQRRIVQTLMDRDGIELRGRTALVQDWLTLLYCGRNGVGHLEVFQDDSAAERYYAQTIADADDFALLPAIARFAAGRATAPETEDVLSALGPVSGIPGIQPKVLFRDWLVKLDNPIYPGLLVLEELAYDLHRQAGFNAPDTQLLEIDGLLFLASRRFDRVKGEPIAIESLFSIWATQAPKSFRCNTDGSVELIAETMQQFGCPASSLREMFGRFVLSLLSGNGDLHSENVSLFHYGASKLAHVYDPAPMRFYRGRANHDLLSALPFDGVAGVASEGYRPYADSGETPPDLAMKVIRVGQLFGLSIPESEAEIQRLLELTESFLADAEMLLRTGLPVEYCGRAPDIAGTICSLSKLREAMVVPHLG